MNVTIHRGTNEIGGSCVEVVDREDRVLIDIGMPLLDGVGGRFDFQKFSHMSARGLVGCGVLPNVSGAWAGDDFGGEKSLDALLLSHAHLDHYGLIDYVRNGIPTYLGFFRFFRSLFDFTSVDMLTCFIVIQQL